MDVKHRCVRDGPIRCKPSPAEKRVCTLTEFSLCLRLSRGLLACREKATVRASERAVAGLRGANERAVLGDAKVRTELKTEDIQGGRAHHCQVHQQNRRLPIQESGPHAQAQGMSVKQLRHAPQLQG